MSNKNVHGADRITNAKGVDDASVDVFWEQAGATALFMFLIVTFVVCLCWVFGSVVPAFELYTQSVRNANLVFAFNFLALLAGIAVMVMTVRVIRTYFPDKG
jgi:hypothetical protein